MELHLNSLIKAVQHSRDVQHTLVICFIVFCLTVIASVFSTTIYSDTQAIRLIEAMSPSIRTLCLAVISASSIIIPLMLTMLGFTRRMDREFERLFFDKVRMVTFLGVIALFVAMILLLLLTVPITDSPALNSWHTTLYYIIVGCVAAAFAFVVAEVLLLYSMVNGLISLLRPEESVDPDA